MNRLISAAAAVLAAATAASVATAVVPALAAPRPLGSHAVVARGNKVAAAALLPVEIASKLDGGKYVTVVHCSGTVPTAPSVHLGKPDAPLTVTGDGSSPQLLKTLATPHSYKTVYTCTVAVEVKVTAKKPHPVGKAAKPHQKARKKTCEITSSGGSGHQGAGCTKQVTLNTGFGGLASRVAGHHPGD